MTGRIPGTAWKRVGHHYTDRSINNFGAWLAIAVAVVFSPATTLAQRTPDGIAAGAIARPEVQSVRLAGQVERLNLDRSPAWRGFTARHGNWFALWNTATQTPHRAFGPPIHIAPSLDAADAVEDALRAFIVSEPDVFDNATLERVRIERWRDTWYATFRQTAGGLPILGADWEFRVGANGDLFAFGADAHRVPASAATATRLPAAVARLASRAGLPFDATRDRIEGGNEVALLPVIGEAGLEYRQVLTTHVVTIDPPANWLTYVDAANGEVLWRQNRVRYAISGTVTGSVHLSLPTDPGTVSPLKSLTVNVGASPQLTDASGNYSASPGGTVTVSAQLLGPYCNVNRQGAADASFSTSASDPSTVNIDWATAHDAERNGFYHVNFAHDYIKTIDPTMTGLDYAVPTAVNINSTCNAYWDGTGLNFYAAGGGCPNMATMPDVVYHEYGHGINDATYILHGSADGMVNGALHEGMADVNAAMIQDSPDGGKGFFGPGTVLRTLNNTKHWPEDASGDGHMTGLIIGGAFWDLREAVGLAVTRNLEHFAKYGIPDDQFDDGVAMNEYFLETLVADDTNNNLADGTPHFNEIVAAFNAHGIGTGMFITLSHAPLGDQAAPGPYPISANANFVVPGAHGQFGGLAGPPILHYAANNLPYQNVVMTPAGGNNYSATIPDMTGCVVSYYISATDLYGASQTAPAFAPGNVYRFLAGPASVLLNHDQETDQSWTAGAIGDNATTGLWIRTNPVSSLVNGQFIVQPEDDHTTDPGVLCWVTGNAAAGAAAGTNDVDGGKTTLTTPIFDATTPGFKVPVVSYYRWYSNNLGADPSNDTWRVDISNDGGNAWVPVEATKASSNAWQRILLRIADYVTPTQTMRMRFIAEDALSGSLIEALVDDWQLLAFADATVAVGPTRPVSAPTLSLASANPASGPVSLSYALPAPGSVSLRVYDVRGREVRTLVAGTEEAASRTVVWDGRDEGGHNVPTGAYYARMTAGATVLTRTILLTH